MSDPNVIEQPQARPVVACSDLLGISERLEKLKLLKKDMNSALSDIIGEIEICETRLCALKRAAKEGPKKNRLRLSLQLRSKGKTFKEVGEELGVCAGRAQQIFHQAERWWNAGRL